MRVRSALLFSVLSLYLITACSAAAGPAGAGVVGVIDSADGVPITYRVAGNGDTALVFVHCWSCDGRYWDAQMDHFAKNYRVVAVDLAGHGGSGFARAQYTVPAFAADVVAVIEQLNLKRVVLVGHSIGGPIIIEVASQAPERIVGLIAVDSFETGAQWPKPEELSQFLAPFEENFRDKTSGFVRGLFKPSADPALVTWISHDMASAPPEVALSALREGALWTHRHKAERMASLGVPLWNINAEPQRNLPAKGNVVIIGDVGHFLPQVRPAEFNQALENILAKLG
ncbi:MAG: alpha/beta hydrolase [Gammaproteobacteria bacterium]